MTPTALNLFFVQCMLSPVDPRGWEKFLARQRMQRRRQDEIQKEKERASSKKYRINNPEKAREVQKRYKNTPERRVTLREYTNQYFRNRRLSDPEFKLLTNLRNRLVKVLKRNTSSIRSRELLGMEIKEYRIYLQGQFRPGMSWENYGSVWEVDHIRPCARFDLSDPAQQRECFNWSNTQPLFAEENLRKGDRV